MQASGTFEVALTPLTIEANFDEDRFARMSIEKTISGDIEGKSVGEMLSLHGHSDGSAGYVAIEQISASIHGSKGSFALQHSCTMHAGNDVQNLIVVPGSGDGELAGIEGTMQIDIADDGSHSYRFDYQLPK